MLQDDYEKALTAFGRARDVFDELLAGDPGHLGDRYRLAICCRLIADSSEDVDDALQMYETAEQHAGRLALRNPDVAEYTIELARAELNHGLLLADSDEIEMAVPLLQKSVDALDRFTADQELLKRDQALGFHMLSFCLADRDPEQSAVCRKRAAALLQECLEESPDDPFLTELRDTLPSSEPSDNGSSPDSQ